MTTRKVSNTLWDKRYKQAKKLGLVKGKKPKTFSSAEKQRLYRIDRKLGDLGEIAVTPKSHRSGVKYTATSFKVTPKQAKEFRTRDYAVYGDRVVIKHKNTDAPKLRKNVRIPGSKKGFGTAIEYAPNKKKGISGKSTIALIGSELHYKELLESHESGNLPKNVTLSIRIGTSAPFNTTFKSAKQLDDYITKWEPKDHPSLDRQKLKDQLITQILVSIY